MSKITDMLKAWTAGTLGGGADLNAVDEDITVVNEHGLVLTADTEDPSHGVTMSWSPSSYSLDVVGTADADETTLYVRNPNVPGSFCGIDVNGPIYAVKWWDNNDHSAGLKLNVTRPQGGLLMVTGDLTFGATQGVVLTAPDASLHRLKVANDGSLSTEPVV